ncbi:MAG: YceD family protein [Parvibaculales bacterium]
MTQSDDEEAALDALKNQQPLFSYIVLRDDVPPNGLDVNFEADATTCAALAQQFQLEALEAVSVQSHIVPFDKAGLRATGRVCGRVQQICGVTLEPVWTQIEEDFTIEFQPADILAKFVIPDDDVETDLPEALTDGQADIGDMAMQYLALAIPPWPRHADAEFDNFGDGDDDEENQTASPFAVLAKLRDLPDEG